jgi:hypothetical protein
MNEEEYKNKELKSVTHYYENDDYPTFTNSKILDEVNKRMKIWHDYDVLAAKRQVEKLNRFIYKLSIIMLFLLLFACFKSIVNEDLTTLTLYVLLVFATCRNICDIDN